MTNKQSLTLPNRFCFNYRQSFTSFYRKALEQQPVRQIELDFSLVDYIDSAALGMLVLLHRNAVAKNVRVLLKGASGDVSEILDMANMSKYFVIEA